MDAIFALLGGLAGTAVFAQFHEVLIPALYLPTSLGPITLTDWIGSKAAAVVILFLLFGFCAWVMGKVWGYGRSV